MIPRVSRMPTTSIVTKLRMNSLRTASSEDTTESFRSPRLVAIALATAPLTPMNRKNGTIPVA